MTSCKKHTSTSLPFFVACRSSILHCSAALEKSYCHPVHRHHDLETKFKKDTGWLKKLMYSKSIFKDCKTQRYKSETITYHPAAKPNKNVAPPYPRYNRHSRTAPAFGNGMLPEKLVKRRRAMNVVKLVALSHAHGARNAACA